MEETTWVPKQSLVVGNLIEAAPGDWDPGQAA